MLVVTDEITIAEIDEALNHMREKLQDRYGNRLTWKQKQLYWASIDDLLEARLNLTNKSPEGLLSPELSNT
jgi:hypothetical protein